MLIFFLLYHRPNKFKIINMNIPIVKWTNPMTKEVFTDKVLKPFKNFTEIFVS